jgi:hypothetical protein
VAAGDDDGVVEVKRAGGVNGELKFWVLTAGGKAERSATDSHKVTIELVPQTPEGTSFIVSDDIDGPPPG